MVTRADFPGRAVMRRLGRVSLLFCHPLFLPHLNNFHNNNNNRYGKTSWFHELQCFQFLAILRKMAISRIESLFWISKLSSSNFFCKRGGIEKFDKKLLDRLQLLLGELQSPLSINFYSRIYGGEMSDQDCFQNNDVTGLEFTVKWQNFKSNSYSNF